MGSFHQRLRAGFSALAALAASATAGILGVYGPRGTDTEILKASAETLHGQVGGTAAEGRSGSLTWRWTPGAVLGPEFSFGPDKAAYFLTEDPVRFGPGFQAGGRANFGASSVAAKMPTVPAPARGALKVSRRVDRLLLGYPLGEAGNVSIEVYSLKGARLVQWNGRREAGSHLQAVPLPAHSAGEMLVVRWRFKNLVNVQRVQP